MIWGPNDSCFNVSVSKFDISFTDFTVTTFWGVYLLNYRKKTFLDGWRKPLKTDYWYIFSNTNSIYLQSTLANCVEFTIAPQNLNLKIRYYKISNLYANWRLWIQLWPHALNNYHFKSILLPQKSISNLHFACKDFQLTISLPLEMLTKYKGVQ